MTLVRTCSLYLLCVITVTHLEIFQIASVYQDTFYDVCPGFFFSVSNKPGICVKVLTVETQSCQLAEEMAQLADCALPTELRVRTLQQRIRIWSHCICECLTV